MFFSSAYATESVNQPLMIHGMAINHTPYFWGAVLTNSTLVICTDSGIATYLGSNTAKSGPFMIEMMPNSTLSMAVILTDDDYCQGVFSSTANTINLKSSYSSGLDCTFSGDPNGNDFTLTIRDPHKTLS